MWEQLRRRYEGGGGTPGGGSPIVLPSPWLALSIALAVYLLSGIFIVAPDERAVVLRFGAFAREQGPGPGYHLPWPIEEVYKPSVTQIRKEEFGFRSGLGGAQDQPSESMMLTGDQNIVALQFIVQYRIRPDATGTREFLFNVRDQTATVRAAAEAAMREVVGRKKIDDALTQGRDEIQSEAQDRLQQILDTYKAGIEVNTVKLMNVDPPSEVEDAFKDVINAQQDKERMMNKASGYANAVIPQARGEAAQALNEAAAYRAVKVEDANGAAQRFLSLYEAYSKAKEVTLDRLYLETLEEILPRVEKVIVESDASGGVVPYLPLDRLRQGSAPAPATVVADEEGKTGAP